MAKREPLENHIHEFRKIGEKSTAEFRIGIRACHCGATTLTIKGLINVKPHKHLWEKTLTERLGEIFMKVSICSECHRESISVSKATEPLVDD